MAKSLATLFVDLRASSRHLKGDINRAMSTTQAALKRAQAGMQAALRGVSIATGAATAALTSMGIAGARSVDKLANTAAKLGIPIAELQGLQAAAEKTGVSTDTLNMGLQRMTRRISEAAKGTGEARGALAELGLSAKEVAKLSPEEQFRQVADAMEGVGNQGDKVRLAMRLFDSEGVDLVNTLALQRSGLDAARTEIERYGLAVTKLDAARVQKAMASFSDLVRLAKGFGQQVAIAVAPAVTLFNENMISLTGNVRGFGDLLEDAVEFAVIGFAAVADTIQGLHKRWLQLNAALADALGDVEAFNRLTSKLAIEEAAKSASEEVLKAFAIAKGAMEPIVRSADEAGDAIGEIADSASGMRARVEDELTGLVTKGKFNLKSLADYAVEQFARMQIVDPIIKGLGSILPSGGLLGDLFGGFKAEGGPVSSGKAYVVGERGPELFMPQSSGTIIPNGGGGGGGGDIIIHQHNNFSPGVQPADLMVAASAIKEETLAAVYEARRRGGAFA